MQNKPGQFAQLLLSMLDKQELAVLAQTLESELQQRHQPTQSSVEVPLELFSLDLLPSESLILYLKDHKNMTFKEIGTLLFRDEAGCRSTYERAFSKSAKPADIKNPTQMIPISCFNRREYSVLESLMLYLVDTKHLRVADIAETLNKPYSTLYTTYTRAKKKQSIIPRDSRNI